MKVAPLWKELLKYPKTGRARLVHTGQHYDTEMSDIFFRDLELPKPDRFLGIGSGTHAEQTGKVMMAFEKVCVEERPDLVMVVGDVNSTMACALTAKKLCIQKRTDSVDVLQNTSSPRVPSSYQEAFFYPFGPLQRRTSEVVTTSCFL